MDNKELPWKRFPYWTTGVPSCECRPGWDSYQHGHKRKHRRKTPKACEVTQASSTKVFGVNELAQARWVRRLCSAS